VCVYPPGLHMEQVRDTSLTPGQPPPPHHRYSICVKFHQNQVRKSLASLFILISVPCWALYPRYPTLWILNDFFSDPDPTSQVVSDPDRDPA
jgi:hypothetical protein